LDIPGKINLILSDRIISKDDFASAWNYTHSGLKTTCHCGHDLQSLEHDCHCGPDPQSPDKRRITILSDRIFIQNQVVETLCHDNPASNRIYSYLANSINSQPLILNSQFPILNSQQSIPYSFITAVLSSLP